jgi:hypothetical protein
VILIVVSLPFLINVDQFRPTLQSELTKTLGREVTLGNLRLRVLAGEVMADDLSVAEDPAFGKPAFLRAKSLHVGVEIWPFLFARKLVVTELAIDQPEIVLVQSPTGDWNFSSLGAKSKAVPGGAPPSAKAPLDLSVQLIKVSNGRMTLRRTIGHWKPLVVDQVSIELRNFSATSAFPLSLSAKLQGGGTLKLDGTAGPINPADSAMTPVKATFSAAQLDLAGSGMNDFVPGIAGLLSVDGNAESDGVNILVNSRDSSGGFRFCSATQSSETLRRAEPGRRPHRERTGAPYWDLCRAGRIRNLEHEVFRPQYASTGFGIAVAGHGSRAAGGNVAAGWGRQRDSFHGGAGGPPRHRGIAIAPQYSVDRVRSFEEDVDH